MQLNIHQIDATMSHFDEKTKLVTSPTEWGSWYQTIDEVVIEIDIPYGTRAKQVSCHLTATDIKVVVKDQVLIEVRLLIHNQ